MRLTSINLYQTFEYSQPQEYHFSHDSVFLARRVFDYILQNKWQPTRAVDLCSGCGVIGMDLLYHLRAIPDQFLREFDFLEIQKAYESHFLENIERLAEFNVSCRFINRNYSDASSDGALMKYDLIVCNPPYFDKGQGKLPPSELKMRSRFFIDSDLESLIEFIYRHLNPNGKAFVLIRDQKEHGRDQISKVKKLSGDKLKWSLLEDIRGTRLVLFSAGF